MLCLREQLEEGHRDHDPGHEGQGVLQDPLLQRAAAAPLFLPRRRRCVFPAGGGVPALRAAQESQADEGPRRLRQPAGAGQEEAEPGTIRPRLETGDGDGDALAFVRSERQASKI